MTTVNHDAIVTDDHRRAGIYRGEFFLYSPNRESLALVEFAREMIREAFDGRDPETAQFDIPVEAFAALLADLKPRFIHHRESKRLIRDLLLALGCDSMETFFDVPRLRTSTSDDYLTTGIAYAFHPHRDTWYSAPFCQINWWLPVYPITSDNAMAFHPNYWQRSVLNSSERYDYAEWNRTSRKDAAKHIGTDTREQPKPLEPLELQPDLRLLPPPGGTILFSAAQLHSSVPNTSGRTRFSIDFRTVHLQDVRSLSGAANVDSRCTGSTMGDYLRCDDYARLPQEAMAPYDGGPPQPVVAGL